MKQITKLLFVFLVLTASFQMKAQEMTITGTVTSSLDEAELPGVSVVVQGTQHGTGTDFDGNYTIEASQGDVLLFSFVGMVSQAITVADSGQINVVMKEDAQALDEVIVTALGMKQEKKALTYSAQEVKGDELTRVKQTNPINSLSGKVAGLSLNKSAAGSGGSVKVVLRGNSSTRNNQPLYVIDGVPVLNSSSSQPNSVFGDFAGGNRDGGDAMSLINPDDIESMTVLKGASAAALYGSQGANGVILITTKSGREGNVKVTLSSTTTFEEATEVPEFQTSYGALPGSEVSWGPSDSFSNHVDNFFESGFSSINSLTFSAGTEKAQTFFSYANTTVDGITPNNELHKNNITVKETAKFFDDKLNLNASITLSDQRIDNKPVSGLYFNPLTGLYLFPRGNDFDSYKNDYEIFDSSRNLMTQNWLTDRDIEQNPYWIINRNKSKDVNQRAVATIGLDYKINEKFSLKSRMSYDKLFNSYEKKIYAGTQATLSHANGRYVLDKNESTQMYADLIGSYNSQITEDLSLTALLGTSITDYRIADRIFLDSGTSEGLKLANWFQLNNFSSTLNTFQSLGDKRQVQSIFASAHLGWKDMFYLDVTGRNDWSSTLVNTEDKSFFYPSVGLTAILTEMFDFGGNTNFGKVRLSYAEVGNDIPSFVTSPVNHISGPEVVGPVVGPRPGESLKPESQKAFEFGTEWRFYDNRLGFELTYYNTETENQYITVPAPPTNPFGYQNYAFNAGSIQNSGVELMLYGKPIRNDNLTWTSTLNFAINDNEVKALPKDLGGKVVLTEAGVNNYRYSLVEGEPFGVIEGKKLLRDDQGRIMLDTDGKLQIGGFENVGNSNPDFTLGWANNFDYKNFNLYFHIDGRFGGEVMSITEAMMDQFGVSKRTGNARDNGGVKINAVNADGSEFTGLYDAETYYSTIGGRAGATGEYVYDASNVRLRELSLGYTFNLQNNSFLKAAKISLVGRNLFFFYKEAPYDPNISLSTGEGLQGIDVFGLPTTRSIGFNFNVTF